jgi:hypothetical protein
MESHLPVINDMTEQIILILLILQMYKAVIVDVEMAFLHGVLKEGEEIYEGVAPKVWYTKRMNVYSLKR